MFFFGLVSTIAAGFDGKNGIDSGRVSGRARRPQRLQKVGARLRAGLGRQRRLRRFFRPGTSTAKKNLKPPKSKPFPIDSIEVVLILIGSQCGLVFVESFF